VTDEDDDLVGPAEVLRLRETLMRLPGIMEVSVQPTSLVGFDVEALSLAELADLPSGAIRRTGGGLPGESVVQVWIELDKRPESWATLEFLAWYVRDSCRGGDVAQMRVRGLPPQVGHQVQIGETLLFVIEWFVIHPDGDTAALLSRVQEEAESLNDSIDIYGHLVGVEDEE
jgi:hypothetical protein